MQLFEAMGMFINEDNFNKFALPSLVKISAELKARHPDTPIMVFARGASFANEDLSHHFDVVTIDDSVTRSKARQTYKDGCVLQGNYDPAELIKKNAKDKETVEQSTEAYLKDIGPERLIANLAGGLTGKESVVLVKQFVDSVHNISRNMMKK